jgi:hypothetical protein
MRDIAIMKKMQRNCFGHPNHPKLAPFVDQYLSDVSKLQGGFVIGIVEKF